MRTNDILRICSDLGTWDIDDLVLVCQVHKTTANQWMGKMMLRGLVERIRVGHAFLYVLTAKANRRVAELPPIDENEIPLPLAFLSHVPQLYCDYCGFEIEDMQGECWHCKARGLG